MEATPMKSHGVNVDVEKTSPTIKFLKALIILISMFSLGYYIRENYIKWNITPEITINEKFIQSREIPFPAVTICPPLIMRQIFNISKYFKIPSDETSIFHNANDREKQLISTFVQVCNDPVLYEQLMRTHVFDFNFNLVHLINYSAPTMQETLLYCLYFYAQHCDNLFTRTLTNDGYCFTFNMLSYHSIFNQEISSDFDSYKQKKKIPVTNEQNTSDHFYYDMDDSLREVPSNWSLEIGYSVNGKYLYPARANRLDYLEVGALIYNSDIPNFCEDRKNSYKIIFHLPNELPTLFHTESFFELKTSKAISITAEVSEFDESLRKFSPEERGCYFKGERKLRYFKSYTKLNCEYECIANTTLDYLNCTKFSLPRTNDMKVCNIIKYESYVKLINNWPESYYIITERQIGNDYPCNCMESCNQIKYSIKNERSFELREEQSNIYSKAMTILRNEDKNYTISAIKVSFPTLHIRKTTSFVAYKLQNFISDVGGLIGLFLGFSLISLFELILQAIALCKKIVNDAHISRYSDNFKKKISAKFSRSNRSTEIETGNCDEIHLSSISSIPSSLSPNVIEVGKNVLIITHGRSS